MALHVLCDSACSLIHKYMFIKKCIVECSQHAVAARGYVRMVRIAYLLIGCVHLGRQKCRPRFHVVNNLKLKFSDTFVSTTPEECQLEVHYGIVLRQQNDYCMRCHTVTTTSSARHGLLVHQLRQTLLSHLVQVMTVFRRRPFIDGVERTIFHMAYLELRTYLYVL